MKFVFFFSLFQSYNPELKRQKLFVLTPVQQKKNRTKQNKACFCCGFYHVSTNNVWISLGLWHPHLINSSLIDAYQFFITNQSLHWPTKSTPVNPNTEPFWCQNAQITSLISNWCVCVCSFRMKFGIENCARNLPQINIFSRFTTRTQ